MTAKRLLMVLFAIIAAGLAWFVVASEPTAVDGPTAMEESADGAEERDRLRTRQPTRTNAPDIVVEPEAVPADEPAIAMLRVTVIDNASGEPLEDARVTVAPQGGGLLETHTDATGVAVFDPAPTGGADVAAYATGLVRGFASLRAAERWESSGDQEIEIQLATGERLVGRVVDQDGRPVGGVTVDLEEGGTLGGRSSMSAGPLLGSARTTGSGEFAFDGVPADEMVTLLARHGEFARYERTVRLVMDGANAPFEIRLVPGGAVTGTVRGPDLAPVADAVVYVAPADLAFVLDYSDVNIGTPDSGRSRVLAARTDDDGRYRVSGLQIDATYVALATKPGIGRTDRVDGVAALESAPTVTLDFQLRPVLDLVIRVVDMSGERVEGASVLCLTGRFHRVAEGSDGAYRIGDLDPGEVTFDVDADGYVKQRVVHPLAASGEFVVRMDRGLSISGIAVSDSGEPLAGASIRCMRPMGDEYRDLPDSLADTTTDDDGGFDVGGLRSGAHMVLCWAKGHDRGKLEPVAAGTRDVRVVAPRNATVTLQLRLPAGASQPSTLQRQIRRAGGGSGTEVDWPEDGLLEVQVPPIPATLVIIVEGYADVPIELEMAAGERRDLGVVVLGQGVTATGLVSGRDGRPIAGAEVTAATPWSFDGQLATTGEDGRFQLPRLARTAHEVTITAPGFLTQELARDPRTDTEWNVTLARGGLVTGRVSTAAGIGVADVTVAVIALDGDDADDRSEYAWTENTGRYEQRMPPGRYRVEYQPEEGDPIIGREVTLTEGSEETIDFALSE